MILGTLDDNYYLTTCYWDGSSWNYKTTQDSGLEGNDERAFDFAWEQSGSKGLLV